MGLTVSVQNLARDVEESPELKDTSQLEAIGTFRSDCRERV